VRRLVPDLPRAAWTVLAGDALSAVGTGMTLPFFVVYLNRIRGIDLGVAGLALATVALASFVGNVVGGSLSDRIGPRRSLAAGLVTSSAGAAWFAFVAAPWEAFAAAAVIGLGASVVWPSQDALLATLVSETQRSSVFSVRHGTLNLGLGVGAVAAAVIVDLGSPRSFEILYLADATTFLLFLPVLALLGGAGGRVVHEDEDGGAGGYGAVLRDRTFLLVWGLTALLVTAGYAQFHASLPVYATGTGGISARALAVAFAVNTFAVAAVQLPVLHLLRGRRRTGALALAASGFGLAWAVAVGAAHGGGVVGFALALGIFAVAETMLSPALSPIVNHLAPDRLRGRYNGVFILAWTTGFTLGPALAGEGLQIGDGTPFFVGLVVACGLAAFLALGLRRSLPEGADDIPLGEAPVLEPA
jgi:MFS family permease